ncbi:MAG: RHS repeat-associated core domain-containing protein [Dokdonella sp.]
MAQWEPSGGHYAARPSDTGFAGSVNASGGYSTQVPLELPSIRGGLPTPLQIAYGGNKVGAAGLGWDVPLSYIAHQTTLAHRRPINAVEQAPQAREQWLLVLDGQSTLLVRNAANTAWVPQRNGAQLELRDQGGGTFVLYDGSGLTYTFTAEGGSAGSRLDNGNLSLLRDVTGPGGSHLHLEYGISTPALPGGGSGLAIDLKNVRYNPDATGSCYKHQITLTYDAPSAQPLALTMLDTVPLLRMDKLTGVDVASRATLDAGAPCGGSMVALRRYALTYQADADSAAPQLQSVTVRGQAGTPEANTTLPVTTYSYGSASSSGAVQWIYRGSATMPGGFDRAGLSSTFPDPLATLPTTIPDIYHQGQAYNTWQTFNDMNGDGRAELTFKNGANLDIGVNTPDAQGLPMIGPPTAAGVQQLSGDVGLPDDFLPLGPLELRTRRDPSITVSRAGINDTLLWRQLIDVNGDGRLDIIDAAEEAGHWVVYLNVPAPNNPQIVMWARRSISIAPMVATLRALRYDVDSSFLPLSKQVNGGADLTNTCWRWARESHDPTQFIWVEDPQGYINAPDICRGLNHERTITGGNTTTEWELLDINGDGYPDFVYDSAPLKTITTQGPPTTPGTTEGQYAKLFTGTSEILDEPNPSDSVHTNVMINATGGSIGDLGQSVFSAPVLLSSRFCPVSDWDGDEGFLSCGFADVNGDGILDQFSSELDQNQHWKSTTATLGSGVASALMSTVQVALPGPISPSDNPSKPCSPSGTPSFETQLLGALRDVNGDGVPDYIGGVKHGRLPAGTADWSVSFGTGTGFGPAKPIEMVKGSGGLPDAFALSRETDSCTSVRADTTSGLYDLDGDGSPEMVVLDSAEEQVKIYHLGAAPDSGPVGTGLAGAPLASTFFHPLDGVGRLNSIDNGYGGKTVIQYRSAKDDASTLHQVPFPETVVSSVSTTGFDNGTTSVLSSTSYAYGGAEQYFDAAYDAFVFPGYQRQVTLIGDGSATATGQGSATINDALGLQPFDPSMDRTARLNRYLTVGRTSAVTTLAGNVGTDAWALLATNVQNDSRRIAGAQYDWASRVLPSTPASAQRCIDRVFAYDWLGSALYDIQQHDSIDQCAEIGFAFQTTTFNWRGRPGTGDPLTSGQTVGSSSTVTAFDDRGRVTDLTWNNDLSDASLCAETVYAQPVGTAARVLNAPMSQRTTDCTGRTLKQESFEYDTSASGQKLDNGFVSNGFVTAHIVQRLTDGIPLGDSNGVTVIREYDSTYDTRGNPIAIKSTRDDGATRTVSFAYEPFGLAPQTVSVLATNADGASLPVQTTTTALDPATLYVLSFTDPNGTARGQTYDGFGRALLSTASAPGGPSGALSSIQYLGFALGQGGPRRIVQKEFTDPVAPASVASANGRIATTYLDSVGRSTSTEAVLGADYPNQTLVVGQRTYDALGRVLFEADAHPKSESTASAYGTTYYFNADGSPSCLIRGNGLQPFTNTTDEGREIAPTCFSLGYIGNREIVSVQRPDALLRILGPNGPENSPQFGVTTQTSYDASGRVREQLTGTPNAATVDERVTFDYDALSHLTHMTRWLHPTAPLTGATTTWRYDSLDRVIELDDVGSVPQLRSYDTWGNLTLTQWTDTSGTTPVDRRTIATFDALDRVIHREDQTNQVVDAGTVNDFSYDQGVNLAMPSITATHVLGRLSKAVAPTSSVSFSYDGLGRVNAQVFTDRTLASSPAYVETHALHADGTPDQLSLLLPDTGYQSETVRYGYDSANRLRSASYQSATGSESLFTASAPNDLDVFGRLRHATYGLADFKAVFADTGRRLLSDVKVTSPAFAGAPVISREIAFGPAPRVENGSVTFLPAFDPIGRERGRTESTNGLAKPQLLHDYDRLGQIASSSLFDGSLNRPVAQQQFDYDALGNISQLVDLSAEHAGTVQATYGFAAAGQDPDQLCGLGYGGAAPPTSCNVKSDGVGNIVSMATRGGARSLTYFPGGNVKSVTSGNTSATFDYDAFGQLQRQIVNSQTSPDGRHDKHFGGLLTQRDENGASVLTRRIEAGDLVATRHGPGGPWTFAFGEERGNRFMTDATGAFVQAKEYQPFGEAIASADDALPGSQPGTALHTAEQWNGGDALEALGLSHLGARLYDPVIGRFLSRDPLVLSTSASRANPYSFAHNDPVNSADPSGLCSEGICFDSNPCFGFLCIGGGSPTGNPGGPGRGAAKGNNQQNAGSSKFDNIQRNIKRLIDNRLPTYKQLRDTYNEHVELHDDGIENNGLGPLVEVPGVGLADRIYDCGTGQADLISCTNDILLGSHGHIASNLGGGNGNWASLGGGSTPQRRRPENNVQRVGLAYGFREGTESGEVAELTESLAKRGAREIHILTGSHGAVAPNGEYELHFAGSRSGGKSGADLYLEDVALKNNIESRYPKVKVILYNAVDPAERANFFQAQAKAAAIVPGICSVGALCYSAAILPKP